MVSLRLALCMLLASVTVTYAQWGYDYWGFGGGFGDYGMTATTPCNPLHQQNTQTPQFGSGTNNNQYGNNNNNQQERMIHIPNNQGGSVAGNSVPSGSVSAGIGYRKKRQVGGFMDMFFPSYWQPAPVHRPRARAQQVCECMSSMDCSSIGGIEHRAHTATVNAGYNTVNNNNNAQRTCAAVSNNSGYGGYFWGGYNNYEDTCCCF